MTEAKKYQHVITLSEEDEQLLLRKQEAMQKARPDGKSVPQTLVWRTLLREAVQPEAMTDEEHTR